MHRNIGTNDEIEVLKIAFNSCLQEKLGRGLKTRENFNSKESERTHALFRLSSPGRTFHFSLSRMKTRPVFT